jgi:hypothetical protein
VVSPSSIARAIASTWSTVLLKIRQSPGARATAFSNVSIIDKRILRRDVSPQRPKRIT